MDEPITVAHSGGEWTCLGWDWVTGMRVWPIDEYLARTNHRPTVADRIRRLNPDGKPEGAKPRGWNPKPRMSPQRLARLMKRRTVLRYL